MLGCSGAVQVVYNLFDVFFGKIFKAVVTSHKAIDLHIQKTRRYIGKRLLHFEWRHALDNCPVDLYFHGLTSKYR
jgi:hypothetical protein